MNICNTAHMLNFKYNVSGGFLLRQFQTQNTIDTRWCPLDYWLVIHTSLKDIQISSVYFWSPWYFSWSVPGSCTMVVSREFTPAFSCFTRWRATIIPRLSRLCTQRFRINLTWLISAITCWDNLEFITFMRVISRMDTGNQNAKCKPLTFGHILVNILLYTFVSDLVSPKKEANKCHTILLPVWL